MKDDELQHLDSILQSHKLRTAVESGTCNGDTTAQLAERFEWVWTIELSLELIKGSHKRLKDISNAALISGDSSIIIPELSKAINHPVLWYLDAHWYQCARGFAIASPDAGNPFPLWDEMNAIYKRQYSDVVIVDDVHCFGTNRKGSESGWAGVSQESIADRLNAEQVEVVGDMCVAYLKR